MAPITTSKKNKVVKESTTKNKKTKNQASSTKNIRVVHVHNYGQAGPGNHLKQKRSRKEKETQTSRIGLGRKNLTSQTPIKKSRQNLATAEVRTEFFDFDADEMSDQATDQTVEKPIDYSENYALHSAFIAYRKVQSDLNRVFDTFLSIGRDGTQGGRDGDNFLLFKDGIMTAFGYKDRLYTAKIFKENLLNPASLEFGFWVQYLEDHMKIQVDIDFMDDLDSYSQVRDFIDLFF